MYATQTNMIRGLSKYEYSILREMCQYTNNLYNVAIYNMRQHYFAEKRFLRFTDNYHECKYNENYKLIQADISVQILRVADRSFQSFFALIKKCKSNEYRYRDVRLPRYRRKGGLFNLIIPTLPKIENSSFHLPVSRAFRKLHPELTDIRIKFPNSLIDKDIKEIRIIPCCNGRYFKIQYVYKVDQFTCTFNKANIISIDLGVNNLATCVSTVGTPFIIDGRKIKSINHRWNKERARLYSIASKQKMHTTTKLSQITANRNNRINDYIKKTARYIINYCINHDIGILVIGYTSDFKRNCNLGKINNQNFIQIPFGNLREQLQYLCWLYNISYIEQEESYTSKSSFLDDDCIPTYNAESPYVGTFSGTRITRGLYRSLNFTINADVNAAANILRKSKQNFNIKELCKGLQASPKRIRLS